MSSHDQIVYLLNNVSDLYKSRQMSDVSLVCDDGRVIKAHRTILFAGSIYFQKLFESDKQKNRANIIQVKGISGDVMEVVINFIYSGTYPLELSDDLEVLEKISVAADYYLLTPLNQYCRAKIVEKVIRANEQSVVRLIDSFGIEGDEFTNILANQMQEFTCTRKFLDLTIEQIISVVKKATVVCPNPDTLLDGIFKWVNKDVNKRKDILVQLVREMNINSVGNECFCLMKREPVVIESIDLLRMFYTSMCSRFETINNKRVVSVEVKDKPLCWQPISSIPNVKVEFYAMREESFTAQTVYMNYKCMWGAREIPDMKNCSNYCWKGSDRYFFRAEVDGYFVNENFLQCPEKDTSVKCLCVSTFEGGETIPSKVVECNGSIYAVSAKECSLVRYEAYRSPRELCFSQNSPVVVFLVVAGKILGLTESGTECFEYNPLSKIGRRFEVDYPINSLPGLFNSAACRGIVYFFKFNFQCFYKFDLDTKTFQRNQLPEEIKYLGRNWELCSTGNEFGSLLFLDEDRDLWEFIPSTGKWNRFGVYHKLTGSKIGLTVYFN